MITDAGTVNELLYNFAVEFTGGDWLFIGILVFLFLGIFLLLSGTKSGGVMAIGLGFAFLLSMFNPIFMFAFWLGLIVSMIYLVNGIRKKFI